MRRRQPDRRIPLDPDGRVWLPDPRMNFQFRWWTGIEVNYFTNSRIRQNWGYSYQYDPSYWWHKKYRKPIPKTPR